MEHYQHSYVSQIPSNQLITSAVVRTYDKNHQAVNVRTLLDTCATANFITEKLVDKLGLQKKKCSIPVGALDQMSTYTKHLVSMKIYSTHNNFEKTLSFLSVPSISNSIPNETICRENLAIPRNVKLADPNFHIPAPVDLLIGAGPSLSLFGLGQINLSQNGDDLYLLKTRLGWVVGGTVNSTIPTTRKKHVICHLLDLQAEIKQFWEIENGPSKPHWSADEIACEKHFIEHTTRDSTGRFTVALPFKKYPISLKGTRNRAMQCLKSLMKRFGKNLVLKTGYSKVIDEYLDLGHMSVVQGPIDPDEGIYMVHLAVNKETSTTTKIRVVLHGSLEDESGESLNDKLHVGPKLQDDLFELILRSRLKEYVLMADIEKMYRQILVRKEDRKYQRLLWPAESGEIMTLESNTVTFGLASSAYLAIRCLHKLADDEQHDFPRAAPLLKKDLYVDNLLTGADSIEEARLIRDEMTHLLERGGFKLRQWASNDSRIIDGLHQDDIDPSFSLDSDETMKTLGIAWHARTDCITYSARQVDAKLSTTKRTILSEIAKIFDPLGLLGPVILYAKMIMQKLWQLKLDWDESVPNSIYTLWSEFCQHLNAVDKMSFNRRVILPRPVDVQLHGFSDASEGGYGACIYIRSVDSDGKVLCKLFCAKSRVAPLKTISLPRLELCGAQLLAKLYKQVKDSINLEFDSEVFWSDSTITLHWIQTSPHLLKTFVANRVSDIQDITEPSKWRHVRSADNPADALSRGQLPSEFAHNDLWRSGPEWLMHDESSWPQLPINVVSEVPEIRKNVCLQTVTVKFDILHKFSSFLKLKRVIACCYRLKTKQRGNLSAEELQHAEKIIIRLTQASCFTDEIKSLKTKQPISKHSKLITLDPYLDQEGIMRVGGRLNNSMLSYTQKHPVILPRSHNITDAIIREYHVTNLHSGIQTTLYAIRQKYWIINGRNQIRKITRKCVKCFRANPTNVEYVMGNLPSARVNPARPFCNVGIDYCGPFFVKEKKYRNRGRVKIYVAVFVCLVVKAVHLEVVSDLTTEAFLAAFCRFAARHGLPENVHSDNGTNFVGANNELKELYVTFNSDDHREQIYEYASSKGIKWHFIPPRAPNFGGLWEAAVKSFKHHLKRVITDLLFTFEEFNTFVIQVEAILNSRPLTPISSDPNDILVLTPSHFLIGDCLTSLPDPDYSSTPSNRLSTYEHILKVRQDFWKRWYKEYLNELNIRSKWSSGQHTIKEGTVVLLKDDNLPPMQWKLCRVVTTHPGEDGVIRAVTVKSGDNELKRSVRHLAPLPIDSDN